MEHAGFPNSLGDLLEDTMVMVSKLHNFKHLNKMKCSKV